VIASASASVRANSSAGAPLSVSNENKLLSCDAAARWLSEHDWKEKSGSKKIARANEK
jgi:hypothetical protein